MLTVAFYGCEKVMKTFYFRGSVFTAVNGCAVLNYVCDRGTMHLSKEGTRKRYLFCPKWYIKG